MGTWYKDFYLTTPLGEQQMRDALADPDYGAQNRADIQQRLTEMQDVPQGRCSITSTQIKFLEGVLSAQ